MAAGFRGASEDALDREAKNRAGAGSRTVSTLHVGVGLPINHKMLRSRKLAKCAFATKRGHAAGRKTARTARVAHMSLSSGVRVEWCLVAPPRSLRREHRRACGMSASERGERCTG